MKMHIIPFNPLVWAVIRLGVQGNFFGEGHEPDHDATADEMKMLQLNAQACDIILKCLCPKEFNKISRLDNAKEKRRY